MIIKAIFWAIIIYFGYKVYQGYIASKKQETDSKVKGEPQKDKLNLNDLDVEDASYREIDKNDKED